MPATQLKQAQLQQLKSQGDSQVVVLKSLGDWTVNSIGAASHTWGEFLKTYRQISIQWNVSSIGRVDSAGMMLFIRYYDLLVLNGNQIEIVGASSEYEKMYQLIRDYVPKSSIKAPVLANRLIVAINSLGKSSVNFILNMVSFIAFVGESFLTFWYSLRHPSSIRFAAIIKNIDEAGVRAIPIIAVTSFLIGVVIAYQGAVQLEKFGANLFIVDMIALSLTRELAPLITAIVVAGRTASSYTAQLGVMKVTEEIDAMRTMGFDPHRFLVQPRILALMISLPLLIFLADIIGIAGGMLISYSHLDISCSEFITRLHEVLAVKQVWIGVLKGSIFAWLIASVGCFYGFQVSKNTESIGRYTTISVVNTIFLVIACDAVFSVVLTALGI